MSNLGYKVRVTGLVQGVCFRYSTAQQAKRYNVSGYAKNLYDGSVEVLMFGEQADLQSLIAFVKHGPDSAVVDSVSIDEAPYQQTSGFTCY